MKVVAPFSQTLSQTKTIIRAPQRSTNNTGFPASWEILSGAISQIYGKNASILSFEELYRNAYNLVLRKHGEKLYGAVTVLITSLLKGRRAGHVPLLQIERLCLQWDDHVTCLLMLRDILMYLVSLYFC
jgi:cullin 3